MIARLSPSGLPAFTAACGFEHVFGSKALTALRAWGLEGGAEFYLCLAGGEPAAALYLDGGVLTVSAGEQADPAEIAQLIRARRVTEVDAAYGLCRALQVILGGELDTCDFMAYAGAPVTRACPGLVPGELRAVFDVLQRSHDYYRTHLEFDSWAADWRRRLSLGLSELYQLELDGAVVGTGSISSEDGECAVIAAVAVVPEHRNRGLGGAITLELVRRIQARGKTARLVAGYEGVAKLYRGLGFRAAGRWGELYL